MKSAMRNKRMVKIMNVSKETDKLEVRKRINKLISSARKMQNQKSVNYVVKKKQVFVTHILFHKCH